MHAIFLHTLSKLYGHWSIPGERIAILPVLFILCQLSIQAQPFYCTGELLLASSPDADSSRFYKILTGQLGNDTITFEEFSNKAGEYLNGMGYSRRDNYVYAIAPNSRSLCRLDANGNVEKLGVLEELDGTKAYNSGAITSDGRYLIVLSTRSGTPPFKNLEIVRIDLQSPEYHAEVFPLTTMSGNDVSTLDIAFHPITGTLFGYDGINGRLLKISLSSYEVDDTSFPATGAIELMAALFFDAWGNLYGYGRQSDEFGIRSFFSIDVNTGLAKLIGPGPIASASDGCSCPYRIEFTKSVDPQITTPCSEVKYKFVVINSSASTQNNVRFTDQLPEGFIVREVLENPYGGSIKGLDTDKLEITGMSIPTGIDSFEVLVEVGDVPPGFYQNQAVLRGLPITLGGMDLSDDPNTLILNDSTTLEVKPTAIGESLDSLLFICPEDSLVLDAGFLPGIYTFSWNTGESTPSLQIFNAGIYDVIATNDCETIQLIFEVQSSSTTFSLDLGPDIWITLGDRIELSPDFLNAEAPLLQWHRSPPGELECPDCPIQILYPIDNTTYFLTVIDLNGCVFQDSINVFVEKDYPIYVPNVFSPNYDGTNDILHVYSDTSAMVEEFVIFDRWGNTVFSSTDHQAGDLSLGWNGVYRGGVVPSGVYVWRAQLRFIDDAVKHFSGDVTVLR